MSENDTEVTVRLRRVSGVRSARVSKCSSSGNLSSCRFSIASFEHSVSTSNLDEDAEIWTDRESTPEMTGLVESAVDSEDDELDIEEMSRDALRESLEKPPAERSENDVHILLDFTQHLHAFANMTLSIREALCKVMVLRVIDDAGTVICNENQTLDSWTVVIQGLIEIVESDKPPALLTVGDCLGWPAINTKKARGKTIRTKSNDCQVIEITQEDFTTILNRGNENIRRHEENGRVVLVTEERPHSNNPNQRSHIVIKGTVDRLMDQLLDIPAGDPTYDEDFLLTYRIVMDSATLLCNKLLDWYSNPNLRLKVARIVLLWVNNHFSDFDTSSAMIEFLEKIWDLLEDAKLLGHLKMLNFTIQTRSKPRTVILSRPNRDEPLQFSIVGGSDRNTAIFISQVEKASKAAKIGLKRADQILQINGQKVSLLLNDKVMELLRSATHLSMTVQTNLSSFKDVIKAQISSPQRKSKRLELSLSADQGKEQDYANDKRKSGWLTIKRNKRPSSARSFKLSTPSLYLEKLWNKVQHSSLIMKSDEPDDVSDDQIANDGTGTSRKLRRKNSLSMFTSKSIPDLSKLELYEIKGDPEHALKIYTADQSHKLIFARKETTVKQVIAEALNEFQISEPLSFYCLCEVTVTETGLVKQRRLPEEMLNLSARLGINSRYYLKNNYSSDPLVTDDLANELKREAQMHLLMLSPLQVAIELTLKDFALFAQIESAEFVDDLFQTSGRKTPNLDKFSELSNREMFWVISEICREPNTFRRMKIIKKFIKIADCCRQLKNFNSLFNIISGLSHNAVSRLKITWEKLPLKHRHRFAYLQDLMNPTRNMSKYRNLVNVDTVPPPIIPFFPVFKKDLTFIHLGNDTRVDGLINFEKFRMIAKEIRNVQYMRSVSYISETMIEKLREPPKEEADSLVVPGGTPYGDMRRALPKFARKKSMNIIQGKKEAMFEEAQRVRRVDAYLKNIEIIPDEEHLLKLSKDIEAPLCKGVNTSSNPNPVLPASLNTSSQLSSGSRASLAPSITSQHSSVGGSNQGLNTSTSSSPNCRRKLSAQELDQSVSPINAPFVNEKSRAVYPALQCPPSPKVVRRFLPPKPPHQLKHGHSNTDVSDDKLCDNSLSAIRKSKLTWSYVSTDSGLSSRSYSSHQPAVSSASSIEADGIFYTPASSKASSATEVSRMYERNTPSKKSPYRCSAKRVWQRKLEPLPNLLPLHPHEAHSWVSSSPTLPVVVVDEADDPQEKPKPAFDFRQGILVLPPLPQQSPISGRAVLRRVAPETHSSTETNPQQENRVASIIRRAHSHHDIS